jgi:hypothetical protein
MYPPTRQARAGKIQIDCIITMDDQEGIQNMYPPTRRARAGKIQIDCYITMDDQEGIQNMYPPTIGGYIFCIPSWSSIVI